MNILVTGGCGFIGSNFIRRLLLGRAAPASRVVNLDKLTYAGNPANLADVASDSRYAFVHGDIGDEALVGRILSEHGIGAVVNFAAESHVDRSIDSPEPFVQTNVLGTLRLLNAVRRRTRYTERWSRWIRRSRRRTRLPPIPPTPPPRRRAITSCARTGTPTGCPS